MKAEILKSIELLAGAAEKTIDGTDAMKFTQAALNLAHTMTLLDEINELR